MNEQIYYAHPISLYNTKQEKRDLELLARMFPNATIYNPNCQESTDGYKAKGMAFFTELINSRMTSCVFRAFPDGSIPAGVATEVEAFRGTNKPVLEIPSAVKQRGLNVDETREFLQETGYR